MLEQRLQDFQAESERKVQREVKAAKSSAEAVAAEKRKEEHARRADIHR